MAFMQVYDTDGQGTLSFRTLAGAAGDGLPLGTIIALYSNTVPTGFLPCNGAQFDIHQFPALYTLLGRDVTPDLRECNLVGAGLSTRVGISAHDVYTIGQFKDDQVQELNTTIDASNIEIDITDPGHTHTITTSADLELDTGVIYDPSDPDNNALNNQFVPSGTAAIPATITTTVESATTGITAEIADGSFTATFDNYRHGATTHGKQVGVNYAIKASTGATQLTDPEIYNQIVTFVEENYTRSDLENLQGGDLVEYQAIDNKFIPISRPTVNGQVLSHDETNGYQWVRNGSTTTHIFNTAAAYNTALLIEEGEPGFIADGDIVVKNWLTDTVKGVDVE